MARRGGLVCFAQVEEEPAAGDMEQNTPARPDAPAPTHECQPSGNPSTSTQSRQLPCDLIRAAGNRRHSAGHASRCRPSLRGRGPQPRAGPVGVPCTGNRHHPWAPAPITTGGPRAASGRQPVDRDLAHRAGHRAGRAGPQVDVGALRSSEADDRPRCPLAPTQRYASAKRARCHRHAIAILSPCHRYASAMTALCQRYSFVVRAPSERQGSTKPAPHPAGQRRSLPTRGRPADVEPWPGRPVRTAAPHGATARDGLAPPRVSSGLVIL